MTVALTQPNSTDIPPYRGRFAPSPTGQLHFGSLIAAVGSYLQARSRRGEWLVRIEDLDPPREVPGAADDILRTLEAYGLYWDGHVIYQSQRTETYRAAIDILRREGWVYACSCSRKEIAEAGIQGPRGPLYPGTCRQGLAQGRRARSLRVRTDDAVIHFTDALQGTFTQSLPDEVGDFIVRRGDGWHAYQLVVVIDDAEQGITEVTRGADLLESTPRQIHLQQLLALPTLDYVHLPVAIHPVTGDKLSKQTHAPAVDRSNPVPVLCQVLEFLDQQPPEALANADLEDVWRWAISHWRPERLKNVAARPMPGYEGTMIHDPATFATAKS